MGQLSINDRLDNTQPAMLLNGSQAVSRLKIRSLVFFLIAVCVSMATVAGWEVWNSRQYHLRDKEVAMSNLAQALAWQAQASIKQADTLLLTLVERLENEGIESARLPRMQRLLGVQRRELSQLHGLFVYDQSGQWIANSNGAGLPNANNSDR